MSDPLIVKFNWSTKRKETLRNKAPTCTDTCTSGISKMPSNAAKSRKKKKDTNPQGYKEYLVTDALRNKDNYKQRSAFMTNREKEEQKEKWKNAKKAQRERKNKGTTKPVQSKHIKDMTVAERRKYLSLKKQESRKKMTSQKKVSTRKKETKRRRIEREETNQELRKSTTPVKDTCNITSPPSRSTIHRKTVAVKEALPNSPRTFAKVMANIIDNASPSKQVEIGKRGVKRKLEDTFVIRSLKHTIKELKSTGMSEEYRHHYNTIAYACQRISKYGSNSKVASRVASSLGIGKYMRQKMKRKASLPTLSLRKKKRNAISEDLSKKVKDHWLSDQISHVVPLKKRVKKGQPLHVLDSSYMQSYQQFRKANPDVKIGYVSFIKLKPSYVRPLKALERSVCCCIRCENIQIILKVLRKQLKSSSEIKSIHDLSKATMCPYKEPGFPAKACADRTCPGCGPDNLKMLYAPLVQKDGDVEVECNQWKVTKEMKLIKTKGQKKPVQKEVKSLKLVSSKYSHRELLTKLVTDMKLFSAHLFRAAWQQEQFKLSKENMPPKSAVLVVDFAENYACAMQDEVQSYHWAQAQVTIHPVMAYINDKDVTSMPTHTQAVYCLTDDPKHDAAAVHAFMGVTNRFLQEKHGITSEVVFSDCCAAQYRGKTSLADISLSKQDSNMTLSRHYFESSHGKSAADGLAAIVKHAATLAVTRRQTIIRNATEFHEFCNENIKEVGQSVFASREQTYKSASREFFLIHPDEIKRIRDDRDIKPLKGIMKIHSVLPTGIPYQLKTRVLSCFCDYCYHGQGQGCENVSVVGEWVTSMLKPVHASCRLLHCIL